VLFAFDRERRAILLVGGDKSENWRSWYAKNVPVADARFAAHQAAITRRAGRVSRDETGPRRRRR